MRWLVAFEEVVSAPTEVAVFLFAFLGEDLDEIGKLTVVVSELFVEVVERTGVVLPDEPFLFLVVEIFRGVLDTFGCFGGGIDYA